VPTNYLMGSSNAPAGQLMPSDRKGQKDGNLTPAKQQAAGFSRQFATAVELPFVIVSAIAVGGLIGFFLDRWLHSNPHLMLALGFLGFFAGLREALRRLDKQ
jgi:F0F1-type ATP synthase assembly protein I